MSKFIKNVWILLLNVSKCVIIKIMFKCLRALILEKQIFYHSFIYSFYHRGIHHLFQAVKSFIHCRPSKLFNRFQLQASTITLITIISGGDCWQIYKGWSWDIVKHQKSAPWLMSSTLLLLIITIIKNSRCFLFLSPRPLINFSALALPLHIYEFI